MNLHAQTVPRAVAEILSITVTGDNVACQSISFPSGHARLDIRQRVQLRFKHDIIDFLQLRIGSPQRDGAGYI
ncbi:hypothetical protein D3C80_1798940 [compost metagenome]